MKDAVDRDEAVAADAEFLFIRPITSSKLFTVQTFARKWFGGNRYLPTHTFYF